jgi:DnaJ-class molecular chaperone
MSKCPACDGTGFVTGTAEFACPACNGSGAWFEAPCVGCGGSGREIIEMDVVCLECNGIGFLEMVPKVVTCDKCGSKAFVRSSSVVYDTPKRGIDRKKRSRELSCNLDCPICGVRVQVTAAHTK